MGAQHVHALGQLGLAHALGAAEDDGAGVLHLVAPELAEVLHVHARPGGVDHRGEAAGDEVGVAQILHGAYHVGELAHAAGLYQHAVGAVFGLDLLQSLGKIADQAAADAAGTHLAYLYSGLFEEAAVHGNFAELVLYEHQLFALVGLGYELLYQRCLARAEKTGKNIDFGHKKRFLVFEFRVMI